MNAKMRLAFSVDLCTINCICQHHETYRGDGHLENKKRNYVADQEKKGSLAYFNGFAVNFLRIGGVSSKIEHTAQTQPKVLADKLKEAVLLEL